MKNKIMDERIELSKLKVHKEVLYVVITVLLLSIFQKTIIFKQDLNSLTAEIVCLSVTVLYLFLRNLWLGNFLNISETVNKKVIIISSFVSAFGATFIFAINNFTTYKDKYTGIFDFLFWTAVLIMFVQMIFITGIGFYFVGKTEMKKNKLEMEDLED